MRENVTLRRAAICGPTLIVNSGYFETPAYLVYCWRQLRYSFGVVALQPRGWNKWRSS